jgi:hypothetical protein
LCSKTSSFVAAEVTRLISNAEGGMMNEEKAATVFARFVSFLHSAFFLLHCAFRAGLRTSLHTNCTIRQASAAASLMDGSTFPFPIFCMFRGLKRLACLLAAARPEMSARCHPG